MSSRSCSGQAGDARRRNYNLAEASHPYFLRREVSLRLYGMLLGTGTRGGAFCGIFSIAAEVAARGSREAMKTMKNKPLWWYVGGHS
jgi:hypothetical protein